jgi:ABC-type amino acid transport substrate-binding protein
MLLAAAAMTVVATLTVLLSRLLTLDDAYITYRYARHLAEGYGLGAWNHTGEHVEGYSSLLWTLLLGGAAWLGVDVRIASKVFGTAAVLIVMAVLFWRRDDRPAVLTGVFLALYLPFTFYAASGMEAVGFASLVTLALVGPAQWQPIVAPLLVAMRPEGALVADSMWRLLE